MLCLGIESSCDETALALVKDGKLIDQVLATQIDKHALFGGVVPELASREHYRFMGALYTELMQRNNLTINDIDLIGVARGPGLLGCLLVGLGFAKSLALAGNKNIIGINHLQAHLLAAGLETQLKFPSLGLLVSGGHTHIYNMKSAKEMPILGHTLDDAVGEACDKFAKMLNLPYPGGALIDKMGQSLVSQGTEINTKLFTRPYIKNDNIDFSFSGLKTAAQTYLKANPHLIENGLQVKLNGIESASDELKAVCASYLYCIASTLSLKMERAIIKYKDNGFKSIIVAGGVAANSFVRSELKILADKYKLELILPALRLCTDNAAMVAYNAYLLGKDGYHHDLRLNAIPRGQIIPDDYLQN